MHLVIARDTRPLPPPLPLMSIQPEVQKKKKKDHNNSEKQLPDDPGILITQPDLSIPRVSIISCTCQQKLSAQR